MALRKPRPESEESAGASGARAEWIETLRAASIFADVRDVPDALGRLAEIMCEVVFRPGESILREGDTGSDMFFLAQGEAAVYKSTAEGEEYKVAILRGDGHAFFGEGGLLDSDARSATIRAETVCRCLRLERAAFERFSGENPQLALPILRRIARAVMARLRKSNGDLMLLYNALVAEIRGG